MPLFGNYDLQRNEDGDITISLTPPAPLGGTPLVFNMAKRFTSDTPIITKYIDSGYNTVSGITMVNSGQGILNVKVFAVETSGIDIGAYACWVDSMASGRATRIWEGYRLIGG